MIISAKLLFDAWLMTEKTKNNDFNITTPKLHPIAILVITLMTLFGTVILIMVVGFYIGERLDEQAMETILNEQCPNQKFVVELDFNDYDPYLSWSSGGASCEQWGGEPITCSC
jgi:hypothetical protein